MTNLADALGHGDGVLSRAAHPELAPTIDVALRKGTLVAVLHGVYASPDTADDFAIRARALRIADPQAVLTGASAAYVAQTLVSPPAVVAAATRRLRARHGFHFEHRSIPAALVDRRHGLRITSPALTAVDMAGPEGAPIDDALRRGVSLDALWAAYRLTPQRAGNTLRRQLLIESRDRPWSPAERRAHRALREARVTGWRTNLRIEWRGETVAHLDLAFAAIKLAIEIDGWEFHGSKPAFLRDRRRDRRLASLGWHVVRFAAIEMDDPVSFVAEVQALIVARAQRVA